MRANVILTVDDSATVRRMLECTLADAGYAVMQADDGEAGLEALREQAPDVIITDINMPRLDGFGFIEQLRQQERFRRTPVLVLTTESDADRRARAKALGATGWIVKPFDPRKLVDAVRRVAA
jgi:two-component system chemotaxis response regulator CheY